MSNQETSEPPFSYDFKLTAFKALNKLDNPIRQRFYDKLMERCYNPHVPSAALHGDLAGCYKIRIGNWRLVYMVTKGNQKILVLIVGERNNDDVYS